ncbi:serine/threonine-protein kinase [Dictyobacter kobayashii]|uniref:non-specific serine/threonine protein kinase n=1 Tax=Dictyobacter kobayashii TaxID=2014872 RepID=A0A402AUP6_9CHLR|nr:serine/threonine-protein kinase [Dictyobacter kobayashii]GCE22856.1 hypothetical protein KDK_66560 [Dictyobacter kobayashii]
MNSTPEKRLGNYRLIRLLGRGGFADVYYGEHVYLKTPAAIKVLHVHLGEKAQANFLQEARLVARLEHPHIITVLEFGIEKGVPYLVMEYAPHGTLRQHYPKGTPLTASSITPYVLQVAAALQHTHDQGLIHRDIKPENMLLRGEKDLLLSDFGIAQVIQNAQASSKEQKIVGTILYMAPEQLKSETNPASDQYALAAVIYEWLSGAAPFYGSFTEIAIQHALTAPPPLSKRLSHITAEIEEVVMIALSKTPEKRFRSIKAFATAFEQASQVPNASTTILAQNRDKYSHPIVKDQQPVSAQRRFTRRNVAFGLIAGTGTILAGALAYQPLQHEVQAWLHPISTPKPIIRRRPRATPTPTPGPGATIYTYHGHRVIIRTLAWSQDSQEIVSAAENVQIWNAFTGQQRLQYGPNNYMIGADYAMAWSPNHQYIASSMSSNAGILEVHIWDAQNAQDTAICHLPTNFGLDTITWSPNNLQVASDFNDGTHTSIVIWDAATGRQVTMYPEAAKQTTVVAWSPTDQLLATADDNVVNIWDTTTGTIKQTYQGHKDAVNIPTLAWSPDGKYIASGSGYIPAGTATAAKNANTIHVWRSNDATPIQIYYGHNAPPSALAWSPDGKHIVSGNSFAGLNTFTDPQIWEVASGRTILRHRAGDSITAQSDVTALAWSPNGNFIASGSINGLIEIWKTN